MLSVCELRRHTLRPLLRHRRRPYLAGSGDEGYGHIGVPSALPTVVAVGGTQLHKSGSAYSETIWGGAGAGCADSTHVGGDGIAKPAWQHDPDCANRTVADISAIAGCSPGVAEYDSNEGGWFGVCGTSVADRSPPGSTRSQATRRRAMLRETSGAPRT